MQEGVAVLAEDPLLWAVKEITCLEGAAAELCGNQIVQCSAVQCNAVEYREINCSAEQ